MNAIHPHASISSEESVYKRTKRLSAPQIFYDFANLVSTGLNYVGPYRKSITPLIESRLLHNSENQGENNANMLIAIHVVLSSVTFDMTISGHVLYTIDYELYPAFFCQIKQKILS
ncbi:unnamed protein product [Protopolystoma xenopodis]|uniref:Uncharacterized protein n=1 Tax=Protopolystoma xenopodis TaxID=117903 RepID=A0A3S5B945_9PLAT|nr:unnamed protein product [Protopolystoma xenopodis]